MCIYIFFLGENLYYIFIKYFKKLVGLWPEALSLFMGTKEDCN